MRKMRWFENVAHVGGYRNVHSCFGGENGKKVKDNLEDIRVDGRRILKSFTHRYL